MIRARRWAAGQFASIGSTAAVVAAVTLHPAWWLVAAGLYAVTLLLLLDTTP